MDTNSFLRPVGYDKNGPLFSAKGVLTAAAIDVNEGNHFERIVRMSVTPDFEKASATVDQARQMFDRNQAALQTSLVNLQDTTKKTAGVVRKAADELASGLAKVEKTANFDRLERYVALLERAATAMTTLSELESSGKLDKIAGALK
jgi:hypothetical protein